ncbi:MAG: S41 family peptidase [Anaerolineaceae bacterium]|jgi:carboxyl-terminal processing protease|nr:S41 family peptidase [Anaerolineaceae bacterium]
MQLNRNKKLRIVLLVSLILLAFSVGMLTGNLIDLRIHPITEKTTSRGINQDQLRSLNQVWEIIHNQYLIQPVDDEELIRGAMSGMMDSLNDPYSAYMSPEEYRSQNAPLIGEYTGIGAWVNTSGDFLIIMSPMPDSPAEMAGLKPGDKVVAIDGEDMTRLKPLKVLEHILGPAGSMIEISVQREGVDKILQFKMERALIPIPSVDSEMLEGKFGYIRLYTFGDNSTKEFTNALNTLLEQGAEGIVFDLRNNTGGYVDTAIEITSLFIKEGVVMIEEVGDGSQKEYRASGDALNFEIPLMVLVNEGTASASEITAGALQGLNRAKLVGTKTFGKGYIQNWVPLRQENGALRITIARWLTPKGRQLEEFGLTPDFQVVISGDDIQNNNDAQLNQALLLLNQTGNN